MPIESIFITPGIVDEIAAVTFTGESVFDEICWVGLGLL